MTVIACAGGQDVTPAAAESALVAGAHVHALLLSLRLKNLALVKRVLQAVPNARIQSTAQEIPVVYLPQVLVRASAKTVRRVLLGVSTFFSVVVFHFRVFTGDTSVVAERQQREPTLCRRKDGGTGTLARPQSDDNLLHT